MISSCFPNEQDVWKPMTHNGCKNCTFEMPTQDESEAQILTMGHTVIAVDLRGAVNIKVQFTKYILEIYATWIQTLDPPKHGPSLSIHKFQPNCVAQKIQTLVNFGHVQGREPTWARNISHATPWPAGEWLSSSPVQLDLSLAPATQSATSKKKL